jgi:hypothetical protein
MITDRKTETRCTDWVPFQDSPFYDAYRILIRASSWGWEQRHEWRRKDGGIRKDGWIRSLTGWPSNVKPVGDDGEPLPAAPYPFCRTPAECSGKGYCPKEFACND